MSKHKHFHNSSRRKFLGQASCAALGSTTFFSSMANMLLANGLAGANSSNTGDYKALVCLLLAGGNDSYNMLVPRGTAEYDEYAATRYDLALDQASLLPLSPLTSDGKLYGLHPAMGNLKTMFDNGRAALVTNVGTLIEPVANATEFFSGAKNIPLGLYSHSDQMQHWQTSVPQSRDAIGWGGKVADMLKSMNSNQDISMNISLSGRNVWQSGNTVLEYSITNQGLGVEGIPQYQPWLYNAGLVDEIRQTAINDMATKMYSNVFKKSFGELTKHSFDSLEIFQDAIANVPPFVTNFSDHYLSQNMAMTAKTIAAQNELGMCRQTFFMTFAGWDHHDEVLNAQNSMLNTVSNAISEFFAALDEIGMADKVTLFTISDFARTLTSNGNGSDHAWGGNQIVAGGAVNGQDIYGTFPSLDLTSPLMVSSRGNIIPTTSTDEFFAELALWFGVAPSDLHLILPNIGNFYSVGSGSMPLGFLPMV